MNVLVVILVQVVTVVTVVTNVHYVIHAKVVNNAKNVLVVKYVMALVISSNLEKQIALMVI